MNDGAWSAQSNIFIHKIRNMLATRLVSLPSSMDSPGLAFASFFSYLTFQTHSLLRSPTSSWQFVCIPFVRKSKTFSMRSDVNIMFLFYWMELHLTEN